MERQPLVSIITPTYNHENFIGQCIESVLAQTYPYWEQIIIDDGSTDKTEKIVAQYKDERIKYIRQNHVGIWRLGETYNKALQYAQGEFIAVLEGDDFWPSYKLERQLPAFEKQEVVISWGKAITNSQGKTIEVTPKNLKWFKNRTKEEMLRRLIIFNFIPSCTVMCRKDALLLIGGFKQLEGVTSVDDSTWLELGLIGDYSRPVDETLGYYRQHAQQVSSTMFLEQAEAGKYKVKYKIDFLKRLPQELRNSIHVKVADLYRQVEHKIGVAHFHKGRIALLKGQWEEASKSFKQSLNRGSLRIKLESLLGLVCAYLRMDLEWAATITRRPRLK